MPSLQVGGGQQRVNGDALDRPMGDILPGSDSDDTILGYLDVRHFLENDQKHALHNINRANHARLQ